MKLIETETRNGSPNGYFDPATGIHYEVDGERPFWVVARFPAGSRLTLSAVFNDYDDAKDELDRIAALISGEAAPVGQGWVKGAPPHQPTASWVVCTKDHMLVVFAEPDHHHGRVWGTTDQDFYTDDEITHHLPTPIQSPKETP